MSSRMHFNLQTRLFLGNSGIDAADKGKASTRFCRSVSNSEYLQSHQLCLLAFNMEFTNLLRRVMVPPLNVSMVKFQTT